MRRRVFLGGLAAAGAAAACGLPGSRSGTTFKVAYLRLGWGGLELIHQLGLMEQKGWRIEWTVVDQINGLVNAFASGQQHVVNMTSLLVGQMYERGVKLRVFGAGVGTLGAAIVAPSAPVESVADLRGRKVGGIVGSGTTQDINASINKVLGFDVMTDTQFVPGNAPADLVNLLARGDVEALLTWEPVVTSLVRSGVGRVLATQQELWQQASGLHSTQVHVVNVTTPRMVNDMPDFLHDMNQSQAAVAELWRQRDPRAVQAMQQVTSLESEVVSEAFSRTSPLAGLTDEMVDTFLTMMRFNREYGSLLQSDVWLHDRERVHTDLFARLGRGVN
jgi:NitT/TauT family transport system substrate-binding protein